MLRQTDAGSAAVRYGVVTPANADGPGLVRLGSAVERQSIVPAVWVIIVGGDDPETAQAAQLLRESLPFVEIEVVSSPPPDRGARVAALIELGAQVLAGRVGIWFKIDADVSFDRDHLEVIAHEFMSDPSLGIASGLRVERSSGRSRYYRAKGILVEGQCRAYRDECFAGLMPLERSLGWDSIDVAQAVANGWKSKVVSTTMFTHHRRIGARDGGRMRAQLREGAAAHRLRYRPGYLVLRALHQSSREWAAAIQVLGFLGSIARRSAAIGSAEARSVLREQQRTRRLVDRLREAMFARRAGRRGGVLLVADPGGHLQELIALAPVWREYERIWAIPDGGSAPEGETVYHLAGPTRRSLPAFVRNLFKAARLVNSERPKVLLTTGAAAAVPFVWIAWLFGCKIIFIENAGRIGLSLSGKLCRPLASRYYVQWPELEDEPQGLSYAGSILFGDR